MEIIFLPFEYHTILAAIVLLFLLVTSAFVSGSEAAFFSLSHSEMAEFEKEEGGRSSNAVRTLLSMQDELLSTILITNNLVNISAVISANFLIDSVVDFGDRVSLEFVVKSIIVTFLLLLFGEIMPKIAATQNSIKFVKLVAIPLETLRKIFRPLSLLLIKSSNHINERAAKKKANISMDDLSDAVEIAQHSTVEDKRILTGIIKFVTTEVTDIMRNRVDIVAIDAQESFENVKKLIVSSGFSRIPVYKEELDEIIGVLYIKDLLPYVSLEEFEWQGVIRKAYYVPENKKINDLFAEFQNGKIHFAVVVDEYGSTQGVVSLEDILEEIVGEISDESDYEETLYTRIDAHTYLFEAKTRLSDFERVFEEEEDVIENVRGEAETLAGLMLEIKREFLKSGDVIEISPFIFTVASMNGRRIDKIKVVKKF